MDISIIIVNFKSQAKTLACIDSIQKSDLAGLTCEIIIIDNASGGNELEDIKKNILSNVVSCKFIQSEINLGMGAGNNVGINNSTGKFILILNPDTILEKNTIKILYNHLNDFSEAGIVGPKLLNPDGSLQYSCFRGWKAYTPILRRTFLGKIFKKHLNGFLMNDFDHNSIKTVDWLMGSCLMFKREVLTKINGGFDERFFMYFEDTDLCRRIKKIGLKVVYNPEAKVVHNHSRHSAEKPWYLSLFINKMTRVHIASYIKYFWKWRNAD
jgi:GT2 family glycosyltransferase